MNEWQAELLNAAVQDDVKAFAGLYDRNKTRNVCYGRFPMLSVLYLYGSRKLIAAYGEDLAKAVRYDVTDEPVWLYRRFATRANRALRYWAGKDEIVRPEDMMAIVGDKDLAAAWRGLDQPDKARAKEVYAHAHGGLTPYVKNGKLRLPRRAMSLYKRITLIVLVALTALALLAGTAWTTVSGLAMTKWDYAIALDSGETLAAVLGKRGNYRLTEDMALSACSDVKCTIDGDGHTLSVTACDTPLWERFDGEIRNVIIEIEGDVTVLQDYAVLVGQNYGKWQGVTLRLKSNLTMTVDENAQVGEEKELKTALLAIVNYGEIDSVVIEGYYSQTFFGIEWQTALTLVGRESGDTRFGGYACDNYGRISSALMGVCLTSTNVDMGGVVFDNHGTISSCEIADVNQIVQISSLYKWSPIVGGIAANNRGLIEYCTVAGTVKGYKQDIDIPDGVTDENVEISRAAVGGVVVNNLGVIDHCAFAGTVTGGGERLTVAEVGGIAANQGTKKDDSPSITRCNMVGTVQAVGIVVCVGGIVGVDYGHIERTVFAGTVQYNYLPDNEAECGMGTLVGVTPYVEGERYLGNKNYRQGVVTWSGTYYLPIIGKDLNAQDAESAALSTVSGVTTFPYIQTLILEEEYWYGKE